MVHDDAPNAVCVAFIGLGSMGAPMARVLMRHGLDVVGYDVEEGARRRFEEEGGRVAASAAASVRSANLVITMLPEGRHVRDALFGAGRVAEAMQPGSLLVEMSTIDPLESDALRAELAHHDVAMVDAPVGRTSEHAHRGTLLIMAGGDPDDLERCRMLFDAVGEVTVDCGGPGKGIRTKIVNNYMSAALNVLSAEALVLAEASGLDVHRTLEVLAGTPAGRGHFTTTYPGKALAGDTTPAFRLRLARKDLAIGVSLAEAVGVVPRVGNVALEAYREEETKGRGNEDWTALYAATREAALPTT